MSHLPRVTRTFLLLATTAFGLTFPGCGSEQSDSGVGSIDVRVRLATPPAGPNEQIDAVDVSLWCEGIDPVLGVPRPPQSSPETFSINVSTSQGPEPYNTIGLLEKQGLPAGDCHLSFSAASNTGNTQCTGEITVAIATNQTTQSEVVLACIHTPRYGGVRTDGTFNQCAEYRQILVTPTTQSIGNLVDVRTEVYDPDGDPVTVAVQTSGACGNVATVGSDTAASCETVSGCEAVVNTVECTDVGPCEVLVAVSDDTFTSCTGFLPDGGNNDAARSTIAVGCTVAQGLCAGVVCPDPGECVTGVCDPADGSCSLRNDAISSGCDLGGSPGVCDGAGACVQCNDNTQCGVNEACVGNVCESSVVCVYEQDFESMVVGNPPQAQPTSLADDGWQVGANVFESDGTTFVGNYFAFPAPNGGAAFSAVATGEGGPDQGAQQLSIYSDYNNTDHALGRIIEAIVFQERTIVAGDVGKTISFTFDAKRGNINDPSGNSTALAFLKTLDANADYATTNFITQDTTNLPTTWGTLTISLPINAGLVGQILQFGAQSRASNYESSGVFYDNMRVCKAGGGGGEIDLRPLPEIYTTGKAINYSPYRAGGPGAGEIPSDAQVLEDLALLQSAGYNLLRLFGGDAVSEKIVTLAAANFPDMRFQQGLFLEGLSGAAAANCDSALNDSQVATAIRLANNYSNVVSVSVGNETSFYAAFMPLSCLEGYITQTRSNVTQPVTADDDYTFYANFFGRSPDNVLRLIDFVSIHTYPFLNYQQWAWRQEGVPAGPLRAEAMMNASLVKAQENYQVVYNYRYLDALGRSVSIGESLPIVIGETGWKWRQTTPTQEIETYAANPVNAKWYYDLMQGWEGSAGGPWTIFVFQTFDEAWKGTDDGWGFWDASRAPNYALCGTPAGAACNAPLYEGAGYYSP